MYSNGKPVIRHLLTGNSRGTERVIGNKTADLPICIITVDLGKSCLPDYFLPEFIGKFLA